MNAYKDALNNILDIEKVEIANDQQYKLVINGNPIDINSNHNYILFTKNENEIALYKRDKNAYCMFIKIVD